MNNILFLTILTIFVTAFIATVIKYRTRDKVLKSLSDFYVTLNMQDGKNIWGRLQVYHNGLELFYSEPHLDPDGDHFETSYLLYQNQYGGVFALKRYHDELLPESQRKREKDIKRTYHPNFLRRIRRRIRNIFAMFRDALGQALTVLIGQMKKAGTSQLVSTQDARIQDTANKIIGTAPAYEPMLEHYIGRKVVLETTVNDDEKEFCGILKDYTASFIMLLDVAITEDTEFHLSDPGQLKINQDLDFKVDATPAGKAPSGSVAVDLAVTVTNKSRKPITIEQANGANYNLDINREVRAGDTVDFAIPNVVLPALKNFDEASANADTADDKIDPELPERNALPDITISIKSTRSMDMVVPRTVGTIRHGAESIGQLKLKYFLNLMRQNGS